MITLQKQYATNHHVVSTINAIRKNEYEKKCSMVRENNGPNYIYIYIYIYILKKVLTFHLTFNFGSFIFIFSQTIKSKSFLQNQVQLIAENFFFKS